MLFYIDVENEFKHLNNLQENFIYLIFALVVLNCIWWVSECKYAEFVGSACVFHAPLHVHSAHIAVYVCSFIHKNLFKCMHLLAMT